MDVRIKKVYEDNLSGKIPDELFAVFISDYTNEKQTLTESVLLLEDEIKYTTRKQDRRFKIY